MKMNYTKFVDNIRKAKVIKLKIARVVDDHIKKKHISKAKVADKLGISINRLNKIIAADFDLTIEMMIKLTMFCGLDCEISFRHPV